MKKILVPTDFSLCSKAACDAAMNIAEKSESELFIVHFHSFMPEAAHVPLAVKHQAENQTKLHGAIQNELQLLVDQAEHRGLKATPMLVSEPEDSIENYIDPLRIDLVVMGSHGAKGIKRIFIGSNTQRFIRNTTVPVLVIKQQMKTQIKKIVFVSDFEEDLIKPFRPVLELANLFHSELDLLYINVPYHFKETIDIKDNIKRFMHQFPKAQFKSHIYDATDEERGIHHFVQDYGTDLIAMVTHGKTGFKRILTQSIAESIINNTETPVLVMNIAGH